MSTSNSSSQPDITPHQTRNTFRMAVLGLCASGAFNFYVFYLAFQTQAWQLYVVAGFTLTCIVIISVTGKLSRRPLAKWNIGLILGAMLATLLTISSLIQDVGPATGALAVALTSAIAVQTLPRRPAIAAIVTGVLVGVTALGLDVYGPTPDQLQMPSLQVIVSALAGGLALICGGLLLQQISRFGSIQAKLVVGLGGLLILTTIVAIAGLQGVYSVQSSFQSAIEQGLRTERLAGEMEAELANASRAERDFLLHWSTDGLEVATQKYVVAFERHLTRVKEIIVELEAAGGTDNVAEQRILDNLVALKPYVTVYAEDFQEVVRLTGLLGLGDTGLNGQFQAASLQIEDLINGRPELESLADTLIQIDHQEENYRINRKSQAVVSIYELTTALKDEIASLNNLTASDKTELIEIVTNYEVLFGQLVGLQTQLADRTEAVHVATEITRPLVADIALVGQDDATTQIAQAQAVASQTTVVVSLSLTIAVLTGFSLAYVLSRQIVLPLQSLARTASAISAGDLTAQAQIMSRDETGVLATTFNSMTSQLRDLINTLEQRVAARTHALATSAEVSRHLSTILDRDQLVLAVVNQVQNAFNYYHVHIYLFDETAEQLVMVGGTGEAGRIMVAQKHKIPRGLGLVGRAATTNRLVQVADVTQEPGWLPNPLLRETKAEVAVPIRAGRQILGVLDVQHHQIGGLTPEDAELLQAIANQVAVALQNARLYTQTRQRADREALVIAISQKIQNTITVESALQTAVNELGQLLKTRRVSVELGMERPDPPGVTASNVGRENFNRPTRSVID